MAGADEVVLAELFCLWQTLRVGMMYSKKFYKGCLSALICRNSSGFAGRRRQRLRAKNDVRRFRAARGEFWPFREWF